MGGSFFFLLERKARVMSPPGAVYGLIGLWLDAKKGGGDRSIYFVLASEAY